MDNDHEMAQSEIPTTFALHLHHIRYVCNDDFFSKLNRKIISSYGFLKFVNQATIKFQKALT